MSRTAKKGPMFSPTTRNLLILAGAAAGGYFVYRKWFSNPAPLVKSATPKETTKAAPATLAHVGKGELVSTTKAVIISAPENPAFRYAKIVKTYTDSSNNTVREFRSPVDGFFTRRILRVGKNLFAEIKPA